MDPSAVAALAPLGPYAPWIIAALVVAVGLLAGFALGRRGQGSERIRELEHELDLARAEMARYRTEVSEHFGQTARLLHDLTLQYRSVYEHLAEGASALCPGGPQLLPRSLAEAAVPEGAARGGPDPEARPGAEASAEATREAPDWIGGEHAGFEELEPLLEEAVPRRGTRPEEPRA